MPPQGLTSVDPLERIWGFHVHQEVSEDYLGKSLILQHQCKLFLESRGVTIHHADVMRRGYGPHVLPMWELRVESMRDDREAVARELGVAIAFCAVNRGALPAYIHPTMHDESLPAIPQLRQEGELNQRQAIWFGERVDQLQDFFFNPPLDDEGRVVDTRTSRVIPAAELELLRIEAEAKTAEKDPTAGSPSPSSSALPRGAPVDPFKKIIRGFHIHVDFSEEDSFRGYTVFDKFVPYLLANGLRPSSTRIYRERENGPHVQRGWEVKFEYREASLTIGRALGVCMEWLMCNRQDFPVFAHFVTWEEGDIVEELHAHRQYAFFMDRLPQLDLTFFENKLPV